MCDDERTIPLLALMMAWYRGKRSCMSFGKAKLEKVEGLIWSGWLRL